MPLKKVRKKKVTRFYSFSRAKKSLCSSHIFGVSKPRRFNRRSLYRMRQLLTENNINPRFFTRISLEQCEKYFLSLIEGLTHFQDEKSLVRIEVPGNTSKRRAENAEKIQCLLSEFGIFSFLKDTGNLVAGDPDKLFFVFEFNPSHVRKKLGAKLQKIQKIKLKRCRQRGKQHLITPLAPLLNPQGNPGIDFVYNNGSFWNQTIPWNSGNSSVSVNRTDSLSSHNGNNGADVLIMGFSAVFGVGSILFLAVYLINRFLSRHHARIENGRTNESVALNAEGVQHTRTFR